MDSNEEYEEEEETLVMAELQGIMESNFLSTVKEVKVLGIGTSKPLIQLDKYTFSGEYQNLMGTAMFFEEKPQGNPASAHREDPDEESADKRPKDLTYKHKTDKKIAFERVFLNKKPEHTSSEESEHLAAADAPQKESAVTMETEETLTTAAANKKT